MPRIITPETGGRPAEDENVLHITYEATEADEECFFLIYHLNIAPQHAQALDEEYRKWLIGRFIMQKEQEREMMEQQRIANAVLPNLRTD